MTQLNLDERAEYESLKRRPSDRDELRVRWSLVFQVVGYILGLFVIYNSLTNRQTATETRVEQMQRDISEMKADVKTLLRRTP